MSDPIEAIVAGALARAGVVYIRDGQGETFGLDFYLPSFGVYIEVKAYHTARVSDQMARAADVIVIQGRAAAEAFAAMLDGARGSQRAEG